LTNEKEGTIAFQTSGTVGLWITDSRNKKGGTGTGISMSDYAISFGKKAPQEPEKVEVPNKDVERLLNEFMLAFENSKTENYGVKSAKATLIVKKSADGKVEVSLGSGILKLFGAQGEVKGEYSQGIEILIERNDAHK